jgi:glycosyltransferase involved in cell wall biosynthesis
MQHCRESAEGRYRPPTPAPEVEHVVVLRDGRTLAGIRHLFPNARLHLWLHDLAAPGSTRGRWLASADGELDARSSVICVSEFLRRRVEPIVRGLRAGNEIDLRAIPNAIANELTPDGTPCDPDRLVFLSSPNKGLAYALTAFQAIREVMPTLRFAIANPGYRNIPAVALPNVEWLGALPPAQALAQSRAALCVFMPNFRIPETFGLVFAEANAVGTPVLAHDIGAAREVLHANNPVLPVRVRQRMLDFKGRMLGWRARGLLGRAGRRLGIFDDYIELLQRWRSGARPRVEGEPRFRLTSVAEQWSALLR